MERDETLDVPEPEPAWKTFVNTLSNLGHGTPLWNAHAQDSQYEIKIGDIGYLNAGAFIPLIGANSPNIDVLPLLEPGVVVQDPSRPPGAIFSHDINLVTEEKLEGNVLDLSSPLKFESSSADGGILVTRYPTSRENATSLAPFRDWLISNQAILLELAHGHNESLTLGDLVLVTGRDVTRDHAELVFSGNSSLTKIQLGPWTQVEDATSSSTPHPWAEWHIEPPSATVLKLDFPFSSTTHVSSHLGNGGDGSQKNRRGECVFIRGFRMFERSAYLQFITYDARSSISQDTASTAESEDLSVPSDVELERANTKKAFLNDPLWPLADYIFSNKPTAQYALVHDSDVAILVRHSRRDDENIEDMVQRLKPSIGINERGVANLIQPHASVRDSSLGSSSRSASVGSSLTPPTFQRSRASTTSLSPSLVLSPSEQYPSTATMATGEFSTASASSSSEIGVHLGRSTGARSSLGLSTHPPLSANVPRRPPPIFGWFKPRTEPAPPSLTTAASPVLPLEELIRILTPPATPSLVHARSLAKVLSQSSHSIKPSALDSIIASLCESSDPALQVAGWDVMMAYWTSISSGDQSQQYLRSDRLAHITMVIEQLAWLPEVWEARYRTLGPLLAIPSSTVGLERELILAVSCWIEGAFKPLLEAHGMHLEERGERERSIAVLTSFLVELLSRAEIVSRLTEEDLTRLLDSFEGMIDSALSAHASSAKVASPSHIYGSVTSANTTPIRPHTHRRHPSSATIPSASPSMSSFKLPADCIIEAYTRFLEIHQTALPYESLDTTLPMLCRCLAHYLTPLPVLSASIETPFPQAAAHERTIVDLLSKFFTGTYGTTAIEIVLKSLWPHISGNDATSAISTSTGAFRIIRVHIRKVLCERLQRAASMRSDSFSNEVDAADENDFQRTASARAEPARFGRELKESLAAWIDTPDLEDAHEPVLEEAAGIISDVLYVYDVRDQESMDTDEACTVGETLMVLARYVTTYRCNGGTHFRVPLVEPKSAPSQFLRTLSTLLARDSRALPSQPPLSTILLSIAGHLDDVDVADIPETLWSQKALSPTSLEWLENWELLLSNDVLFSDSYSRTREKISNFLNDLFSLIKDMPEYRQPLSQLILQFTRRQVRNGGRGSEPVMWRILSEEVVMRSTEVQHGPVTYDEESEVRVDNLDPELQNILDFLNDVALEIDDDTDEPSTSAPATTTLAATTTLIDSLDRPILSRRASGMPPEPTINPPTISSLLEKALSSATQTRGPPLAVQAAASLVQAFAQLVFTSLALNEHFLVVAVRIWRDLIQIVRHAKCPRARLCALSFVMRLRADRDHRLYFEADAFERDIHTRTLAAHINRAEVPSSQVGDAGISRPVPEREARVFRGRGTSQPQMKQSRSRSRAARFPSPGTVAQGSYSVRWRLPERLPYDLSETRALSERLTSYDPEGPGRKVVLPLSEYVTLLHDLLKDEFDWEILSYTLCFLPTQLANKHLFCGPKCREEINRLLNGLCVSMKEGFASQIGNWPSGTTRNHASGLAYHTLTILIGYRRLFKSLQQNVMVELFYLGLSEQPFTARCCLHALSLAAFELRPSMTRYLVNILEKLAQIISNPNLPVHIINFLAIIGSTPSLLANFTPSNFKQVFVVALRYLQDHNRQGAVPTSSWALSQHVRIMCYSVIYLWFLAVKLPDRPEYVSDLVKGLLQANEGKNEIDEPTEVCLDWLARYTYASADPRPASSILDEVIMNAKDHSKADVQEKTWIMGDTSVITIKSLTKLGWIEILSRRPSGLTKILCHVENVPLVGPGDVDPDTVSLPGVLLMDEDPHTTRESLKEIVNAAGSSSSELPPPRPNAITGYVWSETAPSQRRKDVAIDPSFFALQLSSYPNRERTLRGKLVKNRAAFDKFRRTFDYMPVIDTHKVGVLYVAPGQTTEEEMLGNTHGSPAYTRFLENLGRLIYLRGQRDVYMGELLPGLDGEYAYAWWDDIGQTVYHTATLMPNAKDAEDPNRHRKKALIGNDYVRIVWNDSGYPYPFDMLKTEFQFINIIIEPHSIGAVAAYSNNVHEHEYFKLTIQRAPGMAPFTPIGDFKIISAEALPFLVRQLSLHADWFAKIFSETERDTIQREIQTNWRARLGAIRRFARTVQAEVEEQMDAIPEAGVMAQLPQWDFTTGL